MIRLENSSKFFLTGNSEKVIALKNINLTFSKGEYTVIVGANGSGKSTLLNAIAGSLLLDEGTIFIDEKNVTRLHDFERSAYISRIFQNPLQGTVAELSIAENFRLAALRGKSKTFKIGLDTAFLNEIKNSVSELGLGLENKLQQAMGTLSGGQRQALTLLMAVQAETKVLLLDEPTAALDPRSSEVVLSTAEKLIKEKNLTAIFITHQLKDAHRYGTRIIQMEGGAISKDINSENKAQLKLNDLFEWFS